MRRDGLEEYQHDPAASGQYTKPEDCKAGSDPARKMRE